MKSVVLRTVWLSFCQQLKIFGTVRTILKKLFSDRGKRTMKFATKLGIGCFCALVFMVAVGFIGFPKLLYGKIKSVRIDSTPFSLFLTERYK